MIGPRHVKVNVLLICFFNLPQLRDTITVIIHNAWSVDFNKALSSFEPHVKGTRNLIDLARQSAIESGVRFLFTSSVGAASGWNPKLGPFPEELQLDASVAIGSGYGESKYISERVSIHLFPACAEVIIMARSWLHLVWTLPPLESVRSVGPQTTGVGPPQIGFRLS